MDGTAIKQIREDKNLTLEATYFWSVLKNECDRFLNREKNASSR